MSVDRGPTRDVDKLRSYLRQQDGKPDTGTDQALEALIAQARAETEGVAFAGCLSVASTMAMRGRTR